MLRFRLKPVIWIAALRKRAEAAGAFVMVLQKGDPDGGSVTIIVEGPKGESVLYTAQTQMDGTRAWHRDAEISPLEIQSRITALTRMDEDMWVLEITDSLGRHFLDETILNN